MLGRHVLIVLVQPQHPGNVGAAARAMKNMGLSRLAIVDPPAYDPEQARWMAPGCDDVLAAARIVGTLDEALVGVHHAVATTARHRKQGLPVLTPDAVAAQAWARAAEDRTTALLFGREDDGLSTADVLRCESLLRIPTPEHASLNLAQAVLLVCWTLFSEARAHGEAASGRPLGGSRGATTTARKQRRSPRDEPADLVGLEPAVADLVAVLERVGYLRATHPDKVRSSARQALAAAGLTQRHVEALRGMIGRVGWALDHPEADWQASARKDPR